MLLLVLTFLADFLWMVYWIPHWWSKDMSKWNSGLHNFVILCSGLGFLLKIVIIGTLATVNQKDLKNAANKLANGRR